jgi:hypothetical protein
LRVLHPDLSPAGSASELDRYIGYWKPCATSHADLDADTAFQEEVRNAARALLEGVLSKLESRLITIGKSLQKPRKK